MMLLERSALLNQRNEELWVPLHLACQCSFSLSLSLSLISFSYSTSCSVANEPVVKLLLMAGGSVNALNEDGVTPLLLCCDAKHYSDEEKLLRVVRMLLEAGADPNKADAQGLTPIMMSAQNGPLSRRHSFFFFTLFCRYLSISSFFLSLLFTPIVTHC